MAEKKGGSGKPGPILTIGIPLIILVAGGYFAWAYLIAPNLGGGGSDEDGGGKGKQATKGKVVSEKRGTMIKVAGDPWSGYSTFRSEPKLAKKLAKDDIGIEYIDDEKLYDQNERMKALKEGKIDLALTTMDAFIQHGVNNLKDGKYPGVVLWNIDESAGGDAIFLAKDRANFDAVQSEDKVCFSTGTPSEHLWDFASLSFSSLSDLATDNGVVASDCWDKLKKGKVQVAVLWQPFTAIAEKAGYPKVFATGGEADDIIIDIVVGNRDYVAKNADTLSKLANAYFDTIAAYEKDAKGHGTFITNDCGPDCGGDQKLGLAVLEGIDFLNFEENTCLWWGMCDKPSKMTDRVGKTGRLLAAKGKIAADKLPQPSDILDESLLNGLKGKRVSVADLAGPNTKVQKVEEKKYELDASARKDDTAADIGTLKLPNVYFASGSNAIEGNATSVVDTIAEKLMSFPALCVHIWGHTNSVGNPADNKELSQKRAQAIADYLMQKNGVAFPASRFDVRGFGSEQVIMKDGVEDKEASRRTEFKLFRCTN